MTEPDFTLLQRMIQSVLDQLGDVRLRLTGIEQRLDGQMVERWRLAERLDGLGSQIGEIQKRLDNLEHTS